MNPYAVSQLDIHSDAFEEESFNRFYEDYFPRLYNYVYFKVGKPADVEDLTGQIFEKILLSLHRYDESKGSLNTWIYVIAQNHILDHYKSSKKRDNASLEDLEAEFASDWPGPEERTEARERQAVLQKLLNHLGARERELLLLKFYGGCKNRDIAQLTGMKDNLVNVTIHRSLRKIRNLIQEKQIDL